MKRFYTIIAIFLSIIWGYSAEFNLALDYLLAVQEDRLQSTPSASTKMLSIYGEAAVMPDEVLVMGKGDTSLVTALGGKIQTQSGDYFTAIVPVARLAEFKKSTEIEFLHFGSKVESYLDLAGNVIKSTIPFSGGYKGDDVIVGIIDTGIQIDHPDFRSDNGLTRILYLWDQTVAGKPPSGFSYGYEWTKADIDNGVCTEQDYDFHGTHVAGIAAGNGSASGGQYTGIAPNANIVFVKLNFNNSVGIIDGIAYIMSKAKSLGKPCVINLSLGTHYGTHTVSDPFNEFIDQMLITDYGLPGNILVWAAGNDREDDIHTTNTLQPSASNIIEIDVKDSYVVFAFYYSNDSIVPFSLVDPSGTTKLSQETNDSTSNPFVLLDQGIVTEDNIVQVLVQLLNPNQGTWKAIFTPGAEFSATPVNGYIIERVESTFLQPISNGTISSLAAQKNSISVAAMVTRTEFTNKFGQVISNSSLVSNDTAFFSSMGPTIDGQLKPEITAPGAYIISAKAHPPGYTIGQDEISDYYLSMQGTSMAAPMVTGTIALLLEKEPYLSVDQVRTILKQTAQASSPYKTDPGIWDPEWGYGLINLADFLTNQPINLQLFDVTVKNNVLNFSTSKDNKYIVQFRSNSNNLNKKLSVKIYNHHGNLIRDLGSQIISSIEVIEYVWNGKDEFGRNVPTGVYFSVLQVDDQLSRYPVLVVH